MPPRPRKTAAGLPGPLRRSPRLAEKKRKRKEAEAWCEATATATLTTPAAAVAKTPKTDRHATPTPDPASALGERLTADTSPSADYLQSLLPGGLFFGYAAVSTDEEDGDGRSQPPTIVWSVPHTSALLRAHWDADRLRLLRRHQQLADPRGPAGPYGALLVDAELALWAVLQHRFHCGLDDLFRYGLRPDAVETTAAHPAEETAAAAATRYCRKLTTVLVHPLWNTAGLAAVRWLLQRVVQVRVTEEQRQQQQQQKQQLKKTGRDHPAPIVPPYAYSRPPFVDTARQWAVAAHMLRGKTAGSVVVDAASAAAAAAAAAAAEAELARFLFFANTPRDLWMLDWMLENPDAHVPGSRLSTTVTIRTGDEYEGYDNGYGFDEYGGSDGYDDCDDFGGYDEYEREDSDNDSDDNDRQILPPSGSRLRVRSTICAGGLGPVDAHEHAGSEAAQRYTHRQQADQTIDEVVEEEEDDDDRPDDQVLFFLQERDLDHLLALLARPDFLQHAGFAAPACYLAGYRHAHALYGYGGESRGSADNVDDDGDGDGAHAQPQPTALPTCNLCMLAFHDDDDHHHHHNPSPDHTHYFHQAFVRDVPPRLAAEWLLERKGAWLLAARREEAIWRERQQKQQQQQDSCRHRRHDDDVPDIPPFDPAPLARLDRVFSAPAQLPALQGRRRTGRAHAAERWCFGG